MKLADGANGVEIAAALERDFDIPSVFISAFDADRKPAKASFRSCIGWIDKPFVDDQLGTRFRQILERLNLRTEP